MISFYLRINWVSRCFDCFSLFLMVSLLCVYDMIGIKNVIIINETSLSNPVIMEQKDGRCTDNITGWDPQRVTDQERSEPEQQRGIKGSVKQLIVYVVKHFISKEIRYQQLGNNNDGDTTYQCTVISNTQRPVMMIRKTSPQRNHSHNDEEDFVNKKHLRIVVLLLMARRFPAMISGHWCQVHQ